MSMDILDSLGSILGPVTKQVSAFFGDSEESTRAGLRGSCTALVAGLVQKASTSGGVEEIYRTVAGNSVDSTLGSRLSNVISNRDSLDSAIASGESALNTFFGNHSGSVAHAVADVAGLRPS